MFASDPIEQYISATKRARSQGVDTAPASLATANREGVPSVRVILIRGVDERGFVFYTNYGSRKARELTANPRAALCQHWPSLEEQVRVEGRVELADAAESDRYFAGRPRDSQLGAWASQQSAVLPSRQLLQDRLAEIEARVTGEPVPRPSFWGDFRLVPDAIEFWFGRPGRLHERLRYTRAGGPWQASWLYP